MSQAQKMKAGYRSLSSALLALETRFKNWHEGPFWGLTHEGVVVFSTDLEQFDTEAHEYTPKICVIEGQCT